MPSRLRLLICLAAAAFFLAACSSSTLVARDERATAESANNSEGAGNGADDSDAGQEPDSADQDAPDTGDGVEDQPTTDETSDDRGARDDTPTPRELDVTEGFGLGGAEQLEGLLVDCQNDNDLACDILFQISGFDTEEEAAARTCGGRTEIEVTFCTAGIDANENEIVFDPASAGLERIIEACQVDGNMTACDFLYYRSPLDSEFQEIGGTCGGRVNVAIPDCRSIVNE